MVTMRGGYFYEVWAWAQDPFTCMCIESFSFRVSGLGFTGIIVFLSSCLEPFWARLMSGESDTSCFCNWTREGVLWELRAEFES